jgi:hypothetical protein
LLESACSRFESSPTREAVPSKNRFLRVVESGMRSKPECVTMTASQLPVAMRLKSFFRFAASKSSLPATRMLRRIQREQFRRELAEHVVRHGEQRLAGEARAASIPSRRRPS